MIKFVLKKLLSFFYARKKMIKCDIKAKISLSTLKKCGEGCRFAGDLEISDNVNIGRFTSLNGPGTRVSAKINKIIIGSFCSIASGVVMQEYYHKYDRITTYYVNKNIFGEKTEIDIFSKGSIVIEDDVWIGSNSVILSGVTVGRGSIIGAGSVVTRDIPRYSIVAGNPAKIIKNRFDEQTVKFLEISEWWTWDISKLKEHKNLFNMDEEMLLKYFSGTSK